MDKKKIVKYCVDSMIKAGADKAVCVFQDRKKNELNIDTNEMSLLRTTYDDDISLTAIVDNKEGTVGLNKTDNESIDQAVEHAIEIARASRPDEANDISDISKTEEFTHGNENPDVDLMHKKMKNFLEYAKKNCPKTLIEQAILDFTFTKTYFCTSTDIDFVTKKGMYNFMVLFTSKEGKKSSSFNHTGFSVKKLDKELKDYTTVDTLLRQSGEQINTKMFPGKIVGDIIVTPDCISSFIYAFASYLHDNSLITGTSIYKDKLNEQIADPKLTLHSKPIGGEIENPYFYTSEGFIAENSTIIDKGVLKTFLLSLYGANKTGLEKAVNSGGRYVIEPGDASLEKMIKSVKKGILLGRFSGGNPSQNGDFSGVAKNSYYIEDGEIKFPITETMIFGNIAEMLQNIKAISKDRINFGSSVYPWIHFTDLTISGKEETFKGEFQMTGGM